MAIKRESTPGQVQGGEESSTKSFLDDNGLQRLWQKIISTIKSSVSSALANIDAYTKSQTLASENFTDYGLPTTSTPSDFFGSLKDSLKLKSMSYDIPEVVTYKENQYSTLITITFSSLLSVFKFNGKYAMLCVSTDNYLYMLESDDKKKWEITNFLNINQYSFNKDLIYLAEDDFILILYRTGSSSEYGIYKATAKSSGIAYFGECNLPKNTKADPKIYHLNNKYFVLLSGNKVEPQPVLYWSSDTSSWSACTITGALIYGIYDIAYVNGAYYFRYLNKIYQSSDGETWSENTSLGGKLPCYYIYSKYIAVDSNDYTYYSSDKTTWSKVNLDGTTSANVFLYAHNYINGVLVGVSNSGVAYHSTDGVDWYTDQGSVSDSASICNISSRLFVLGNEFAIRLYKPGTTGFLCFREFDSSTWNSHYTALFDPSEKNEYTKLMPSSSETLLSYSYTGDPVWNINSDKFKNIDFTKYSMVLITAHIVTNSRNGACSISLYNGNTAIVSPSSFDTSVYGNVVNTCMLLITNNHSSSGIFTITLPNPSVLLLTEDLSDETFIRFYGSQMKSTYVCKGTYVKRVGFG